MKLFLIGLAVLVVSAGGYVTADPSSAETSTTGTIQVSSASLPMEYINDIGVPIEVLLYVQEKYPGFAVTNVEKSGQNYRLLVDQDDVAGFGKGESFYLVYDLNWKLKGKEDRAAPPPPPATEVTPPENHDDKPKPEPEGGRGSEEPGREEEDKPDPTAPEEEPVTDENSGTGSTDTTSP